jgi:VanZ family protein
LKPIDDPSRFLLWRSMWPVVLMLTILWGSGTHGPEVPRVLVFPHFDKVVHFFVFGLIGTLILRVVFHWRDRLKAVLFAVALTALFGALDEFRQSLNPHRSADLADWAADAFGALVAALAYTLWPFYRNLLETRLNPFKRRRDGGRTSREENRGAAAHCRAP